MPYTNLNVFIYIYIPFTGLHWRLGQHHIRVVVHKTNSVLLVGIEFRAACPRNANAAHVRRSFLGAFEEIYVVVVDL